MTVSDFNSSYVGQRNDILNLLEDKIKKVLDIGCSIGAFGQQIKQRYGAEVTGIEIDEAMAKIAEEKLDRVIAGDIEKIDLEDILSPNYFDHIFLNDILEHMINPWQILKILVAFLDDHGFIVASIPNIRHYSTLTRLIFKGDWPYQERGIHDKNHLRFFTLKNIRKMFSDAGLEIIKIKRNYRIIEKFQDRFSKYFALPIIKDFITFQYLIVARKKSR